MTGASNAVPAEAPGHPRASAPAWAPRARRGRSPRMRVLHVLSSANQLYSGIGRNLFELTERMSDRVAFEFAIDDHVSKNVALLRRFCERNGLPLHVGRARESANHLDIPNRDLPALLGEDRWDAIELLCWANSSTNDCALDHKGGAVVVYTPHNQPISSVPMSAQQAVHTERVHRRTLLQSDVILCDSPSERRQLEYESGRSGKCVFLPIGCNFDDFRPGTPGRREQFLFVGDAAEPRKRIDRVLAVFARLRTRHPRLRLVFVGNRSDRVRELIPDELKPSCDLLGYISEQELRRAYAESLGLFLLSDCEAFGIPILEALAAGTPVFLSRLEETLSLFGGRTGAHFCPGDDVEGTVEIIERTLARGPDAFLEVIEARNSLRSDFDWDAIAEDKWKAMAAAWYLRKKAAA